MAKNNNHGGIAAGALVAAGIGTAFAAYAIAAKALMDIAFDRKLPEPAQKVSTALANMSLDKKLIAELEKSSLRLENDPGVETVRIKASVDGAELVGHYRPVKHPKRIIVAMHGWRSSWSRDFGSIADEWAADRCSVVFAEQRGQNRSGGKYMSFGILERYDCLDWIRWAIENASAELPIYLVGLSMGATTVLMASGLELPANVHGIVADCGFTSPVDIWQHVMNDNLHLPYDKMLFAELARHKTGINSCETTTIEALKKNKIPVLFFHGTDDGFVPVTMTYENYKACAAPKRLYVVPGADHGLSHYVDPEGYHREVLDFYKKYDKAPAADSGSGE